MKSFESYVWNLVKDRVFLNYFINGRNMCLLFYSKPMAQLSIIEKIYTGRVSNNLVFDILTPFVGRLSTRGPLERY